MQNNELLNLQEVKRNAQNLENLLLKCGWNVEEIIKYENVSKQVLEDEITGIIKKSVDINC